MWLRFDASPYSPDPVTTWIKQSETIPLSLQLAQREAFQFVRESMPCPSTRRCGILIDENAERRESQDDQAQNDVDIGRVDKFPW